ncbi:MAG: hypothetical protein Q8L48_21655 [Archangium sp.]|nr:hypothetical protein [Archangium sp.]
MRALDARAAKPAPGRSRPARERQRRYYETLRTADRDGHCTRFLEFSLLALHFKRRWFSRRDYLRLHVKLSTATASRDLAAGLAEGKLDARGAMRLTEYRAR